MSRCIHTIVCMNKTARQCRIKGTMSIELGSMCNGVRSVALSLHRYSAVHQIDRKLVQGEQGVWAILSEPQISS